MAIKSFFVALLVTICLVYLISGNINIFSVAFVGGFNLIGALAMGFMLKAISSRKDYKLEIPKKAKMKYFVFFTLSVVISGFPAQPWSFIMGGLVFALFLGRCIDGLSWKGIWWGKEL